MASISGDGRLDGNFELSRTPPAAADNVVMTPSMRKTSSASGDHGSTPTEPTTGMIINPSLATDPPVHNSISAPPNLKLSIPQHGSSISRQTTIESFSQQSFFSDQSSSRVEYLDVFLILPTDTPPNHPHIIDIHSLDYSVPQSGCGFADLAVTILYNHDPAVLTNFLDLRKKKFGFKRKPSADDGAIAYIERRVKFVTIGFLKPNSKVVQDAITYRIIESATGAWEPLAVLGSLSQNVVGPVLMEKYVRGTFTKTVLMQKIWEGGEGVKFEVKVR